MKDVGNQKADGQRSNEGFVRPCLELDVVGRHHHDGAHEDEDHHLAEAATAVLDRRCGIEIAGEDTGDADDEDRPANHGDDDETAERSGEEGGDRRAVNIPGVEEAAADHAAEGRSRLHPVDEVKEVGSKVGAGVDQEGPGHRQQEEQGPELVIGRSSRTDEHGDDGGGQRERPDSKPPGTAFRDRWRCWCAGHRVRLSHVVIVARLAHDGLRCTSGGLRSACRRSAPGQDEWRTTPTPSLALLSRRANGRSAP